MEQKALGKTEGTGDVGDADGIKDAEERQRGEEISGMSRETDGTEGARDAGGNGVENNEGNWGCQREMKKRVESGMPENVE